MTPEDYLDVCEQAARSGGQVLRDFLGRAAVREKGPRDLVTEADLASQEAIRSTLLGVYPNHAFVGEERPSPDTIAQFMKDILYRTQSAQVTISPEFTYCNGCYHSSRGLLETCPKCGSTEVLGETRVVGYFSKIQNWNKSKRYGELVARHRGRYSLATADDSAFETTEPTVSAEAGS